MASHTPQLAMILVPSFLLAASLVWIAQRARRRAILQRLHATMAIGAGPASGWDGLTGMLGWLGTHVPGASDSKLQTEMMRAGYFRAASVPVFVALRLLCSASVFAFVFLSRPSQADWAGTLMEAAFSAFFCSRLFVICLKLKAEARGRAIRSELPPVVDVLLMVLNSGVSIDQCLHHIIGMLDRTAPHTNKVLRRYIADVDNGLPYETAFERLGQHLGIPEGYDLANLIKQGLLQGGEILTSLDRFGGELAEKRVATAREQIGRKSIYLTIAMLAFFMPVLMITLAGPAVYNITSTLKAAQQSIIHGNAK